MALIKLEQIIIFILITLVVVLLTKKEQLMTEQQWMTYKTINIDQEQQLVFTWSPFKNATEYNVYLTKNSLPLPSGLYIKKQNDADFSEQKTSLIVNSNEQLVAIANNLFDGGTTLNVSANNTGNQYNEPSIVSISPCFLMGSTVQLYNGTSKPIEDIEIGDFVLGAFGECNEVMALHRPLLGNCKMCRINNTHTTSNHHPHIGSDKTIYCGNPAELAETTYNKIHFIIGKDGIEERLLKGLKASRVQKLVLGSSLQTIDHNSVLGPTLVHSLDLIDMPPDTQLYNLVISNSHTYFVEGYAVTGWPNEDDFDYDTWTSKLN